MLYFELHQRKPVIWLACCLSLVILIQLYDFVYGLYRSGSVAHPSYLVLDRHDAIENQYFSSTNSISQSTWMCSGNMNYESEWYQRTCAFKNICYNKEKKVFQFFRKQGNNKVPILFEPKMGHIYEFNINKHGIVALVARATVDDSWGPDIVEENLPSVSNVPFLENVHVLFMHWFVSYNPGHVIWEDIASTYLAMVRLNEYDRNAILIEYRHFPKKGDQFHQMYNNLVPAFAKKAVDLHEYLNNFSSQIVCFRTIVAGGARPMFSIDNEPYTHGKEKLLFDYRTAILRYHGVDTTYLPTRHRILLVNKTRALRRSLRTIINLAEVQQFVSSTYPKINLDVIDWNRYNFTQQLHELYKTTILITPCGGISSIVPFLPEGTHAIIMDFYVNKEAYLKIERYEEGESGSMDGALFNYFPHIRKLYYQVKSQNDYVLDFPGATNTRHDASVRVNTTRLKELIDTALQESWITINH